MNASQFRYTPSRTLPSPDMNSSIKKTCKQFPMLYCPNIWRLNISDLRLETHISVLLGYKVIDVIQAAVRVADGETALFHP